MNSTQLTSLIRSGLKIIGAFLMAHGYMAAGNEVNLHNTPQDVGFMVTIIGMIWSHFTASGPSNPASASILLALLLPAFFFAGCSTAPNNAFKAEAAVSVSVDTAMKAWDAYIVQFHPGTNAELQVKAAFEKYQQAELFSIDTTAAYAAMVQTNSATASTAATTAAAASTAQALSDLLTLIQSFGVKF